MTEVVEASAHARAFQSIARQNALWWPALCGRNTLLRTSASSIRSRSGQVFSAAYEKEPAIGGLFLVCADTWSIFSLKCFAFQTIRPVVSRKKRGFSAHFGPGGAVPPPCVSLFSKLKRSGVHQRAARLRYRGTVAGWKAVASPQCCILPNKARWGKDGGPGGKGTPLRASQGGSLPPNSWSIFSLKRCAFQTIRPVVLRKKRGFSAHFGPGGAVPPPRVSPFSKLKRSTP